jgi:hypothetical protein
VQLAVVLGGVKMYLAFIILVKTHFALSSAFGEWDGMDAAKAHWMTCFIHRTGHPLGAWGFALTVRDVGHISLQQLIHSFPMNPRTPRMP